MAAGALWQIIVTAFVLSVLLIIALFILRERAAGRRSLPLLDEEGRRLRLPFTLLQVRALSLLLIGTATLAAMALHVVSAGVAEYFTDASLRSLLYGYLLLGAAAYGIVHVVSTRKYGGVPRDERDEAVLHWAPTVQVPGMVLTLAVWAVGLTEAYWDTGMVPIAFPMLIFFSTIIVGQLFWAIGVLIGYRRF